MKTMLTTASALVLLLTLLVPAAATAQDQPNPTVQVVSTGEGGYLPDELTVDVGQTVDFDWMTGTHSVTSDDCETGECYRNAAGDVFDSGVLSASNDATFSFTFDEPGVYEFFCLVHSTADGGLQNGTITVEGGAPPPDGGGEDPGPVTPDPDDPVAIALEWSAGLADASQTDVLLGTAAGFADSLASGTAQDGRPLLLNPQDELDERVLAELNRLGAQDVHILGGPAAIGDDVVTSLQDAGFGTTRTFGGSRIETAVEVARTFQPDATFAVLARAFGEGTAGFADSLGVGALAAQVGYPILLTGTDELHPATAQYLQDSAVEQVIVAGGIAAVSDEVVAAIQALGIEVVRLAGPTRNSTAVEIRQRLLFSRFDGELPRPTFLIDGIDETSWASGFAAAFHAEFGVLLTAGETLPGPTLNTLLDQPDILCGPLVDAAACSAARGATTIQLGDVLRAVMDADQEVPPAESEGSGITSLYPTEEPGVVCYRVTATRLTGGIQAAHVHVAPFGEDGDVVIPMPLATTELPDDDDRVGCALGLAQEVIDSVTTDPAAHYVNLHTAQFEGGEVRGQLFDVDVLRGLGGVLTGAAEVPGPGDPVAGGEFTIFDTGVADELCYGIGITDLDPPATAGHIHIGGEDEAGPVRFPLTFATDGASWHCDRGLDPAEVQAFFDDPAGHYVNIHNSEYPDGAIRGQVTISELGTPPPPAS